MDNPNHKSLPICCVNTLDVVVWLLPNILKYKMLSGVVLPRVHLIKSTSIDVAIWEEEHCLLNLMHNQGPLTKY
jgi:hypothetical protein